MKNGPARAIPSYPGRSIAERGNSFLGIDCFYLFLNESNSQIGREASSPLKL